MTIVVIIMLGSCITPPEPKNYKGAATTQEQKNSEGIEIKGPAMVDSITLNDSVLQSEENGLYPVQVVFIGDRSLSFVNKAERPDAILFKPLCDRFSSFSDVIFDLRYGLVFNNSDIVLENYHSQPQELPTKNTQNGNIKSKKSVWVETEDRYTTAKGRHYAPPPNTNWNDFTRDVGVRLAQPPSRKSDIASAVSRALDSFNEHRLGKKYLILATDFEDSYNNPIPYITDKSIVVYCIGVPRQLPVENILQTRVRRMESLAAVLRDITKQL